MDANESCRRPGAWLFGRWYTHASDGICPLSFTGSKISNWGFTATPGPDGSFFAGGIVFGTAFPYNTGALEPSYGGGQFDVGIIKLSPNGSTKVYATYLGGSDA